MSVRGTARCGVIVLALLAAWPVMAQDPSARAQARERELLRRAQAAQREAEARSDALAQEKAKLATQIEEVRAATARVEASGAKERRRAQELQKAMDAAVTEKTRIESERVALQGKVSDLETQLQKSKEELRATRGALEEERRALAENRAALGSERAAMAACTFKNGELASIAQEVLARYRDVGLWDAIRRREPFTGQRRVEVENLIEDALDRVRASRVSGPTFEERSQR